MCNVKCEVVRDLMPLVADDVASVESRQLVQAHLENCSECVQVYALLSRRLPKPEEDNETAFIRFCKKMRWRMNGQKLLAALLAATVILFGLWMAYHNIYTDTTEMPTDWVNLTLSQDASGRVLETYQMQNGHMYVFSGYSGYFDNGIYYKVPMKPVWQIGHYGDGMTEFHSSANFRVRDGKLYVVDEMDIRYEDQPDGTCIEIHTPQLVEVTELRLGTEKDYVTVWKEGDEIPFEDLPTETESSETA